MKQKFSTWYANRIHKEMNNGVRLEDIDIKFRLSTLKPLHASWLIDMYNKLTSETGREVVLAGWRQAGIIDACEAGSRELPSLDPFHDIDGGVDFIITPAIIHPTPISIISTCNSTQLNASYHNEYITEKVYESEDEEDEETEEDEDSVSDDDLFVS